MIRLSSNFTLFFKIFVPTFFIVFYGLITIFFFVGESQVFHIGAWFPYSNLLFYLATVFILYKTVFQLHRIDCSDEYFVVSNYRHSYRYTYDSVASYTESSFLIFTFGRLEYKSPSTLGIKIRFLIDRQNRDKIFETFGRVFPSNTVY